MIIFGSFFQSMLATREKRIRRRRKTQMQFPETHPSIYLDDMPLIAPSLKKDRARVYAETQGDALSAVVDADTDYKIQHN